MTSTLRLQVPAPLLVAHVTIAYGSGRQRAEAGEVDLSERISAEIAARAYAASSCRFAGSLPPRSGRTSRRGPRRTGRSTGPERSSAAGATTTFGAISPRYSIRAIEPSGRTDLHHTGFGRCRQRRACGCKSRDTGEDGRTDFTHQSSSSVDDGSQNLSGETECRMTRRDRPGPCFAVRADRIIAAAQGVRTSWRATKPGRRFARSSRRMAERRTSDGAPDLERNSRSRGSKARPHRGSRSEARSAPRGSPPPVHPVSGSARGTQRGAKRNRHSPACARPDWFTPKGHRLDNRPCIGRQRAGAMADRCTIIICRRGRRRRL